ncbi:MAG: nucleotidyl transferase AbiEii/AbiGii toxin family protein [Neisseriaceae bacterium]|nr:nucleotidyl transferase AbiEii/AbiGii toxin family protein [Neisseriaceae bacterium]
MKLFTEIFPPQQKEIYPQLDECKEYHFILFGGTAIALQLGHRLSVDFDFFTDKPFNPETQQFLLKIKKQLSANIIQNEQNTFTLHTPNGVKISFFGNIPFVAQTHVVDDDNDILQLADLTMLLATKLKTINDRAEWKDYTDIAHILRSKKATLSGGLNLFSQIWQDEVPQQQILKALLYFLDGDLQKLSIEDRQTLLNEVKNIKI